METRVDEIAPQIYRFSTFLPQAGIVFNQFLVDADEPLLFHTGMRALFPLVHAAVSRVTDPARLRWITFGHYEADECGAMNQWLAACPVATVAHGQMGVMVSVADQADRAPHGMQDGDVLDLGGRRIRYISTPHVPHGWDAGVLYEETTKTLFAGDLFTCTGNGLPTTDADIVEPALAAEDAFGATAITPLTAPTMRKLAALDTARLALMHAPAYGGNAPQALAALADAYAGRLARMLG